MAKGHERLGVDFIKEGFMKDIDIFQSGWNEFNAQFFGLIMSDGCLRKEGRNKTAQAIRLSLKDIAFIDELHKQICIGNKVQFDSRGAGSATIKYRNSNSINFMMQNGLTEAKSLTLQFPKNIPDEQLHHFIRGFFDGDGSIVARPTKYNTYFQVSITSGSQNFLQSLQLVLKEKQNIDSQIYIDGRSTNKSYYLRITKQKEIQKFKNMIYRDATICLDRKYQKFTQMDMYKPKYKINV